MTEFVFILDEEEKNKASSVIVKLISREEEESIHFMKCKLPAVENYQGK